MSKVRSVTRAVGTKGMPRHEREQLILNAASEEFGAKGYARGSLTVVAAAAGISKPLILEYFGSKDRLYTACLTRAGTALVDAVEATQLGPMDIDRAARTLTAIFETLAPRPHDWELVYDPSIPDGNEIHDIATTYRQRLNDTGVSGAAALLEATDDPNPLDADILTHIWYGIISSVIGWWRHHPEQTATEMAARCDRVFAAIARSGTPPTAA
jgi:AcrR family transcriptional regulator